MRAIKLILSQILVTLSILICLIFFTDLMPKAKSKITRILNPIAKENVTNLKNQVNEQKQKIFYIKEDVEKLKNKELDLDPLSTQLNEFKKETNEKLNGLSKNQKVILDAIKEEKSKDKECIIKKEEPKKKKQVKKKKQIKKPKDNKYAKYKSCVKKLEKRYDNECQKSIKERITNKQVSVNKEETKNTIKEEEITIYELAELPSFCKVKRFQYHHICLKKYYK